MFKKIIESFKNFKNNTYGSMPAGIVPKIMLSSAFLYVHFIISGYGLQI